MVTLSYLTALVRKLVLKGKGTSSRFFDAMLESRLRRAQLEMSRHLLPGDLERAGWKLTERSEDSLPFVR